MDPFDPVSFQAVVERPWGVVTVEVWPLDQSPHPLVQTRPADFWCTR